MIVGDVRVDMVYERLYSSLGDSAQNKPLYKDLSIEILADPDEPLTPERVYHAYRDRYNNNMKEADDEPSE